MYRRRNYMLVGLAVVGIQPLEVESTKIRKHRPATLTRVETMCNQWFVTEGGYMNTTKSG